MPFSFVYMYAFIVWDCFNNVLISWRMDSICGSGNWKEEDEEGYWKRDGEVLRGYDDWNGRDGWMEWGAVGWEGNVMLGYKRFMSFDNGK